MWKISNVHPVVHKFPKSINCCIKITQKVYMIHCFKRILKNFLPYTALSHSFLMNCNTLPHDFCQKRTPFRAAHSIMSSMQVWEYPPPFLLDNMKYEKEHRSFCSAGELKNKTHLSSYYSLDIKRSMLACNSFNGGYVQVSFKIRLTQIGLTVLIRGIFMDERPKVRA